MSKLLNYGFIKGKVNSFETQNITIDPKNDAQRKSFPHYNMTLKCNDYIYNANINIFSNNQICPDLKVFFSEEPENELHNTTPFNIAKSKLNGVYKNVEDELSLDYIRGKYFDLDKLQTIVDDQNIEKVILYYLIDKHMKLALKNNYDVCLWGQTYDNLLEDGTHKYGIHDIHMNQGNADPKENGTWSDGGFIIVDPSTHKIIFSYFASFSSQCIDTDDNGNCIHGNHCDCHSSDKK